MGKRPPPTLAAWLRPLGALLSKPQRPQALIYLVGLIWLVKFRSLREIAAFCGQRSVDSVQHFLVNAPVQIVSFQRQWQASIARLSAGTGPLLALDDTACRRRGKSIEGVGLHHNGTELIRGQCAVTAMLKSGARRWMWAVRGYRPKRSCAGQPFASKVDLAREILTETAAHFKGGGLTVLMDAWYACASLLNYIAQQDWTYVAALKCNRVVHVRGQRLSLRELGRRRRGYKRVRHKRKNLRVARCVVWLPKVGEVLVFVSKRQDEVRFFVTNDLGMSATRMVRLYAERFWIETMHLEIKQHLGFGELFLRRWSGVQKHWTLVALAYNVVVLWDRGRHRSFRQMVRAFRASVCPEQMLHWYEKLAVA